jgi:hypothetical protein
MSLPKVSHPTFETTLPSGKRVTYRPFTGREQKTLLVAKESGETSDVMRGLIDVLQACCSGVDVGSLPVFDLEMLFLVVRAKSAGAKIEVKVTDEGREYDAVVDFDAIEILAPKEKPDKNVEVSPGIVVSLKFPTAKDVSTLSKGADEWDYLALSVDAVVSGEEVTSSKDVSREELKEWLKTLPLSAVSPMKTFFEARPRVSVHAVYEKDGVKKKRAVNGVGDFFA